MKTLIIGATGATGKLLVDQLIAAGRAIKIIVRPTSQIPEHWLSNDQITIVKTHLSNLAVNEMTEIISDCDGAASCLGHNLTIQGLFGKPRKLVTKAVQLISEAIDNSYSDQPVKFVLMNTAGNRNRDLDEPISLSERLIISLLRSLLPPHPDNEKAADYLRIKVGQRNPKIEWVVVRPDSLLDENSISAYAIHPSPISSAIFKPGKTSRINVAHFMAHLLNNNQLWTEWEGKMPVIYNEIILR